MAFGLGLLGAGFGRLGGRHAGIIVFAPLLTWTGDTSDSTPDFDVDLASGNGAPHDAAAGDILRLQYSSNGGSSWNAYLTHALTSGEIAGDPITVSGVTPLANTDYLFRARLERGSHVSAWSDSEAVTVNAVDLLPYFTIMFH